MHDHRRRPRRGALRALILAGLAMAPPAAAATRGYTITSFDSIRVDAPVTVTLVTGQGPSARAEGDQAMLDRLHVDVSGRTLSITADRLRSGEKGGGTAIVRVSTGMLDRVMLTGGGSISIDRLKGLRGQIVLGGNGDIAVGDVQLDRIDLMLAGGGRTTLAGRTGVANIHVTGPGAVSAEALRARQAEIGNDGPGNVALTAEVNARVVASGSGDVIVAGKAACVVEHRGTGRVLCGGEAY